MFALDASMALAWFFRDEESEASLAVQTLADTHRLVVPPHWFAEVANGIFQGERTGRSDPLDVPPFVAMLEELDIAVDTLAPFGQFDLILPMARQYALTVYDAAYLHCAYSNGVPLATFDRQLAAAGRRCGIAIFGKPS